MWSFEVQWPAPFEQNWKRSGRKFDSAAEAAKAAAEWLLVSAENEMLMTVRLVRL